MKVKTKERIITAIAAIAFIAVFIATIMVSTFIMRAGVAIESEMPSMQKEIQDAKDFNLVK